MYQIKTLQSTQTPKQHKHRLTFSFAAISAANQSTVYSKVTLRRLPLRRRHIEEKHGGSAL